MTAIPKNEKGLRMGYMGTFIEISNLLDFEHMDEDEEWVKYKEEGELYTSNQNNKMPLAGHQTAQ